jgi:hypothetical protein
MMGDFVAKDHPAPFVLSLVRDDLGQEITRAYGSERGQTADQAQIRSAVDCTGRPECGAK